MFQQNHLGSVTHTESPWSPMCTMSGHIQGMTGAALTVWHQMHGGGVKVTIYYCPPNISRIITSWQEDLVENDQMGFDGTLSSLSEYSLALHIHADPAVWCNKNMF